MKYEDCTNRRCVVKEKPTDDGFIAIIHSPGAGMPGASSAILCPTLDHRGVIRYIYERFCIDHTVWDWEAEVSRAR